MNRKLEKRDVLGSRSEIDVDDEKWKGNQGSDFTGTRTHTRKLSEFYEFKSHDNDH